MAPASETFAIQDREEFKAAYVAQLEALGAGKILGRIERVAGGRPAVLLCWEKPNEFCHRRLLADWLHVQAAVEIPELRAGMLQRRPDAPQQALFD